MKILFLLPYVFIPPNSGNKNLTYNLLKHVSGSAVCDLVILIDGQADVSLIEESIRKEFSVRNIYFFQKPGGLQRVLTRFGNLIRGYHYAMGNYWSKDLAVWLLDNVSPDRYDIVHFDMIHMSQYRRCCRKVPSLLIASDSYSLAAITARKYESNILYKLRLTFEAKLLFNIEKRTCGAFTKVCTVSPVDAAYLRERANLTDLSFVGIAIEKKLTSEEPRAFEVGRSGKEPGILCTGSLSNRSVSDGILDFLKHSLPGINKMEQSVRTTLLGRNPVPALRKFLNSNSRIKYIDFVEDYIDFLNKDWVYIYPQQCGSGFQTKVQQAMALGLPVVGYPIAFSGMQLEHGKHCFVCDSSADMEKYVTMLLRKPALRREIGIAAANRIRELYSIDSIGEEMMNIYTDTISNYSSQKSLTH